jgi:hypothetical protein
MAPDQPRGQLVQPDDRSAASASRMRVRWLVIVIAVMILLTGGWPLINTAVSNRHPLKPGERLMIGPGHGKSGQIMVGPGWSLLSAASNPLYGYTLRHGAVLMSVNYISLVNSGQAQHLWAGLRQLLLVTNPGTRLGRPGSIISTYGHSGSIAMVSGKRMTGSAAIFVDPSRDFAVEMIMLAPRTQHPVVFGPGLKVITSLQLPAGPA